MTQNEFNIDLLKKGELILRSSDFCKAYQVGIHGRMFGGFLMAELDSACAVFVAEVCDTPWVVTKKLDTEFISPVFPDQIFKCYIGIETIGTTSIKLNVEIRKYSVETEKETLAIVAKGVFVRINQEGEAIKISDHVRTKYGYNKLNN